MPLAHDYLIVDEALPKATITLNRPSSSTRCRPGLMRELTATLAPLGGARRRCARS